MLRLGSPRINNWRIGSIGQEFRKGLGQRHFFFFSVLEIESRAPYILSKRATAELYLNIKEAFLRVFKGPQS